MHLNDDNVFMLYHKGKLVGHINSEHDGYWLWLWWPEVRDRLGCYKTFDDALAMYNLLIASAGGNYD